MPIAQAIAIAPTGTRWARLPRRRPATAVNRNPKSGSAMISGIRPSNIRRSRLRRRAPPPALTRSLAHHVVLVDERCMAVPIDRDDDRQPDRRLGCRDGDDDEGDDRSARPELLVERAERDDRE